MSTQKSLPPWAFSPAPYRHKRILFDSTDPSLAERIRLRPFNQQQLCPLYRIPAEIRNAIFRYTMMEYPIAMDRNWDDAPRSERHGFDCTRHSGRPLVDISGVRLPWNQSFFTNSAYFRPGFEGMKKVSTGLLRTCKRVYLEAHHLPSLMKEHLFWHSFIQPPGITARTETSYFRRFTPTQLDNVKAVRLFVSQPWLERHMPQTLALSFLQGIEKLTLTIGEIDWIDDSLHLDALRGFADVAYQGSNTRFVDGGMVTWNDRGWGWALKQLPILQEFRMVLETYQGNDAALKATVSRAKTWEFPCHDERYVLSAQHQKVVSWEWELADYQPYAPCPQCSVTWVYCHDFVLRPRPLEDPNGTGLIVMEVSWKIQPRGEEVDLKGMRWLAIGS